MSKYVIVGAGAAGVSAAEAIRSLDNSSEILLVHEEVDGYYSRPGLAYYLSQEIPEGHLYPFQEKEFEYLKVRRVHARAQRILPHENLVELQDGKLLTYDRLLIATGAYAAPAKVHGVELQGVVKIDTLDDARRIIKQARKARSAVVVGGGITALELVEGLRARGVRVHYFLRGDRYWSNVLDKTESQIVEHKLEEDGVQIHYHTEIAEILGKRDHVVGVRTVDGHTIKCEMVGIAIGVLARKSLGTEAGLKVDRGILVDEYLRTSAPDIYAAGDVAQVYDPILGKAILDSLWGPARMQGYTAGLNMTGQNVAYSKGVPFNVTRLAGLTTTIIGAVGGRDPDQDIIGIVRGDSETWRQIPDAIAAQSDFDINHLRVLVGDRFLLGAIVIGDQKLSMPIHHLISQRVDITSIRERLLHPGQHIANILADFWSVNTSLWEKSPYAAKQS
jgi:NAD(P)H-nitrite reductase large subunit